MGSFWGPLRVCITAIKLAAGQPVRIVNVLLIPVQLQLLSWTALIWKRVFP